MSEYRDDSLAAIAPTLADARDKWWQEWEEANPSGLSYDIEQGWDAAWDCIEQALAAHDAEIRAEQIETAAAFVDTFNGGSGIALALRALCDLIRPPAPELIPGTQAAVDALSIRRKEKP